MNGQGSKTIPKTNPKVRRKKVEPAKVESTTIVPSKVETEESVTGSAPEAAVAITAPARLDAFFAQNWSSSYSEALDPGRTYTAPRVGD